MCLYNILRNSTSPCHFKIYLTYKSVMWNNTGKLNFHTNLMEMLNFMGMAYK